MKRKNKFAVIVIFLIIQLLRDRDFEATELI